MKSKYFVRGLGVGVLVTAILFAGVSMLKSNSEGISSENGSNKGNIVTEAPTEETEAPEESVEPSASPVASELPQATDAVSTEAPTTAEDVVATQSPDVSGEGMGNAGANVSQSGDSSPTDASQVMEVTIKGGSGSYSVASLMESKGLVDDADAFNDYMVARGYDEKINAGTYQIKKGATYEQIARTITAVVK